MSYKILTIPPFDKQVKRLSKKYPSLKNDLISISIKLSENPNTGLSLGNNCYKIRFSIKSKGKGKSSGGRIISHFYIQEDTVFLLAIYDKSEVENLSDKEILKLLTFIV
jgi:mRNA-degrading endonuclease RelE of RelBE toxin-antitoxin system